MRGITKRYPNDVLANNGVDLSVERNEIHAVVGENGAGKTTLMRVLCGLEQPDSGAILLDGRRVAVRSPLEAGRLGIGMVHQHFKLVHNYTVAENIILGMEPRTASGGIDLTGAERRVAALSEQYGLRVDPRARIEAITVGMQQRVEILKILYRSADVLIFDEPTAVLTPQEIDELMAILRRLSSEGKTVILITHKLGEIKQAAGRCTILRRGKRVATVDVASTSEQDMAEMMVGRAVRFDVEKGPARPGEVVLRIEGLTVRGLAGHAAVQDLSLKVRAGEVVGIAGVDGNGQAELVSAITGLVQPEAGRILLKGVDVTRAGIRERIRRGLGHVPEDRQRYGLILDFRLDENLVLKSFDRPPFSSPRGILRFGAISEHAERVVRQFDIRAAQGAATRTGGMSGGNQQKAVIAREIDLSPELLVVAQPTRGLDVGAIEYIHRRIIAERDKGRAVLLVSFELDEIMNLCDRIAAISRGRIVGTVEAGRASEREIGAMMAGLTGGGAAP
jgi:simple sugar transport system ATP-binding protein